MVPELNNHEKIGRALEHLRRGLLPLIKSRLALKHIANWQSRSIHGANRSSEELDVKDCLEIVNRFWDDKYSGPRLGRGERAWVNELIAKVRNQHAHRTAPEDISYDDTWRALDTAERLLAAMQSPESRNIRLLRMSMRAEAPIAKPERVEAQSIAPQPAFESPRNQRQKGAYIESLYAPDLLGGITVVGSRRGLISIRFGQGENKPGPTVEEAESQLREYADGRRKTFDLLWDVDGTPFQVEVWRAFRARSLESKRGTGSGPSE